MSEGFSLTKVLNDEPQSEPVEVAETEQAPEPQPEPEEAPSGPQRDDQGRFVSTKGVEPQEQPAETVPPTDKLPKEDYKAIREEREKRQNLERELASLREQVQSLQQPKEPPAPPPSMWEDEQGWQQHFGAQVAQQAALNAKLDMSEMMARDKHEDFDAMKASFLELAQQNPAVVQQALSDPHPWARAYQIAKNASTMAELGATDLDTLKAKLREELMAEMQAPAPEQSPVTIPPTLTAERNVGSRSGPAWTPKTLTDFLR